MQSGAVPLAQTNPEPVAVFDRAHAVVLEAVKRSGYPHRALASRLASLMGTVLESELNEDEMRMISDALDAAIDDTWHPVTTIEGLHAALRTAADADRAEDAIRDIRLYDGDCPVHLAEHEKRLARQSVTSRTAARALGAWFRRTAATTRQRLGLPAVRAS